MHRLPWAAVVALSAFGCKPSTGSASSLAQRSAQALPEKPAAQAASLAASNGFDKILPAAAPPFEAATPVLLGQGYFRRAYVSGAERVEITIARFGKDPGVYTDAFDQWVAASTNYPQAQLSLPAAQANGFFSCASDLADAACDLHIQLRSGFHVEVMGNGRAPRRDLIELMNHVLLANLSDSTLAAL
jgi:hypothetical protein